jgi:peptidoglycan/xylan/chitin deacetylase (PgdA/CDA1 family)
MPVGEKPFADIDSMEPGRFAADARVTEADAAADGRPRAIVLTFDNLGEASELGRGTWDRRVPLGRHRSVTVALPRLLDELDALGLVGTFFVEALNCELYPKALLEIVERGHELGVHGWCHEPWAQLSSDRERDLLVRARRAFCSLGLRTPGFRPPGGEPTVATGLLLSELGYLWWSPAVGSDGHDHGPATIPFDWELVDAYHLMEGFAPVRARRGDSGTPLAPTAVGDRMCADLATASGAQVVILHPFLMLDSVWWETVRRVLALIARLSREGRAWAGPGSALAKAST